MSSRDTHANRGVALENSLDQLHARYERQGLASVIRIPTPYKVLGHAGKSGGSLIVVPKQLGEPDYHVQAGGNSFLLDAKSSTADRWPLSGLPAHQVARFESHHLQGGEAFILLFCPHGFYLLPWGGPLGDRWRRWARGEAKRGEATLDRAGLYLCGGPVLTSPDWLARAIYLSTTPPLDAA